MPMYFVGYIMFSQVTAFAFLETPLHFLISLGVNDFTLGINDSTNVIFYWNGFWSFWEL